MTTAQYCKLDHSACDQTGKETEATDDLAGTARQAACILLGTSISQYDVVEDRCLPYVVSLREGSDTRLPVVTSRYFAREKM